MDEKDEGASPSAPPSQFELSIKSIFQTIQMKLNKTNTEESNGNMLITNPAPTSNPSGDALNPATSYPGQNHTASVGSVLSEQEEDVKMLDLGNGQSESCNRPAHPLQDQTHCDVKEEVKEEGDMNSLERAHHPQQEKETETDSGVRKDDTNNLQRADSVANPVPESKGSSDSTAKYRDPGDTDTDSDSDSDTSSLSSFEVEVEVEPESEKPEKVPRSKGEILPEELPPLQNLHISLTEETRLEELGVVTGIVGVLVVIESTVDLGLYSPLNEDSVLFYENRQPFGIVFDVFGPCKAPSYAVRFNCVKDIQEKGIQNGLKIFFVPDPVPEVGTITHYVFVQKLKQIKGSDASWKGNNEPPQNCVEYSDDEEERRSKRKRKPGQEKGREEATDQKTSVSGEGREGERQGNRGFRKRKEQSWSSSDRQDGFQSRRGAQTSHGRHSQQFPSADQDQERRRGPFGGRDTAVFRPAFNRPQNPDMDSAWRGPPHAGGSGPQSPGFRMGPPENARIRGPFSGGPSHGPHSDAAARPLFPGWPGNASFQNPLGRPPFPGFTGNRAFPGDSGSGSFGNDSFGYPGSRPFGGSPSGSPGFGSFGGSPAPPNCSPADGFWQSSPAPDSPFSTDTSLPPPNLFSFQAGQANPPQRAWPRGPPGPPHGWTSGPPPQGPY